MRGDDLLTLEQKKIVEDNIGLAYHFVGYAKRTNRALYVARMDDDDMVSIAFYALCVAAKAFDASLGYAFSTLYYRICLNEFRKILRKVVDLQHGPYYASDSLSAPIPETNNITIGHSIKDDSPGPEEAHLATLELDVLHRAIEALDETLKNTVRLYHFGGLGQPDIARAHGVQQSAVSRRLDRAYKKIAAHMAANGY